MKLPAKPRISVVVITRNEGEQLRDTVENLRDTLPSTHEIVVVDDGFRDGSTKFLGVPRKSCCLIRESGLGVARARNLGARSTTGDIIVFADAHLRLNRNWWQPLVEVLAHPRAGSAAPAVGNMRKPDRPFGYGLTLPAADLEPEWLDRAGSDPFLAPVLPGCCLAMKRSVFQHTGGYDEGLKARGRIDPETSLRLWLMGYESWVAPESKIWHYFRRCAPFPVTAVEVLHNRLRLAMVHLRAGRIAAVIEAYAGDPALSDALLLTVSGRVAERRQALSAERVHDDNWFFEKFDIRW